MFARIPEVVPKREKNGEFFLAKRIRVYVWLLAAVAVLALALMFFDLPLLGWAVLIVCLIVWAVREARGARQRKADR